MLSACLTKCDKFGIGIDLPVVAGEPFNTSNGFAAPSEQHCAYQTECGGNSPSRVYSPIPTNPTNPCKAVPSYSHSNDT